MNAGRNGLGRPGEVVATWVRRGGALACALGLALGAAGAWAQGAAAAPAERLALGLIVKLKDKQVASVVRLPASVRPSDTAQAQRLRMAAATNRKRVGFLVQKPTAYGAHVIHQGHYTTVAEAEAEAAKLRLDPDVEWVVVNRMERAAAGVQFADSAATLTASAYDSHKWMHRRVTGGTGVGSDVGVGPGVANFRKAWETLNGTSATLSPVVVAVLDTGKLTHPDLDARTPPGFGYDFVSETSYSNDGNGIDPDATDPGDCPDENFSQSCALYGSSWHGAAVMSVLTPLVNSSIMGPGALSMLPATVAKVLPVRIGGTQGALVSDIIEGMLWSAGVDYQGSPGGSPNPPARVINLSFGSDGNCLSNDAASADPLYRQTIATLRTKGALVVSSAGNGDNDGSNGYVGPTRPASCPGVMAVTALRYDGSKAYYANTVNGTLSAGYHGLAVAGGDDQASPQESLNLLTDGGRTRSTGVALESDCPSGQCFISEGTSFAAPQVAAVAALMLSVKPTLTVDELVSLMLSTATAHAPVGSLPACDVATGNCSCTQTSCGKGVVNAEAALLAALSATGTFSSPNPSAPYFVPERLKAKANGGGGGGGATDDLSLLALMASVLGLTWWRWRSEAQARAMRTLRTVRIGGDRLKGGKR